MIKAGACVDLSIILHWCSYMSLKLKMWGQKNITLYGFLSYIYNNSIFSWISSWLQLTDIDFIQ